MNSYDANAAPNFQGEFNDWCGACSNTGTDADMDGIYSFTQYLSPKTWAWKPTIGAWSVISSAPEECSFDTDDNNYFFEVGADDVNSGVTVDVGPVCFADGFGTCGACETCTPATECTEDMVCGTMDDGCGGTVDCGTCGDGESCNAGVCEADAPAFTCEADYAGCTEEDFVAGDMTAMDGTIAIDMVGFAPYSPKCLRVAVGQTVSIEAMGSHPFQKVCAEDDVMDSQDLSTSTVTFTMATPGYYNYKCQFHGSMVGNIHVVAP